MTATFVTVDARRAPRQLGKRWYCSCEAVLSEHKMHYGIVCDRLFWCPNCQINWILDTTNTGAKVWRRINE